MQLSVCCYQIVMRMINKSKQLALLFVNTIHVKIHTVQNVRFNQRGNQEIQSVLFCLLFVSLVLIALSSLMSSNPSSSSLSNSSAVVSRKSEDSAFSTQLLNKLSAVPASLATSASSMTTQHQAASAQCLQASLAALPELNSRNDVPITRNVRSAEASNQFNDELRQVCEGVRDSEHQREDSLMTVMLKWALSNSGSMEWSRHHRDIIYFRKSFNLMQGTMADLMMSANTNT